MFRTLFGLLSLTNCFAADLIVVNANIITVDKSKPYAAAFAIENGKFQAVGTNAAWLGPDKVKNMQDLIAVLKKKAAVKPNRHDLDQVSTEHPIGISHVLRATNIRYHQGNKGPSGRDMVLTAIERAQAKNPRPDARHRIEHASVMNQSLLDRAQKDGVILVFHSYMWEHGDKLASYGENGSE